MYSGGQALSGEISPEDLEGLKSTPLWEAKRLYLSIKSHVFWWASVKRGNFARRLRRLKIDPRMGGKMVIFIDKIACILVGKR